MVYPQQQQWRRGSVTIVWNTKISSGGSGGGSGGGRIILVVVVVPVVGMAQEQRLRTKKSQGCGLINLPARACNNESINPRVSECRTNSFRCTADPPSPHASYSSSAAAPGCRC